MKGHPTSAHEFAQIFPLHDGSLIAELGERIVANGQREPIVLLDGKILDGRRREMACIAVKVDPKYREFGSLATDGEDALEFVIDTNLHRRHLGDGELAMAAAKYATARVGQPKKESYRNGTILQEPQEPTNKVAAQKFNVSERKLDRAKAVLTHGTPELQDAVANEEVTLHDAEKITKEEPAVQKQAVEDVREGKTKTARQSVENQKDEPKRRQEANTFDTEGVIDKIGILKRSINHLGKKHPGKGHSECLEILDNLVRTFNRWQLASK